MKRQVFTCDICKADNVPVREDFLTEAIFTTEQTEGRSCTPYLVHYKLDVCEKCIEKKLKGEVLYGAGAQGYNRYWFKGEEK